MKQHNTVLYGRSAIMEDQKHRMITATDIMERLSVSKSTAYSIMREINDDLEKRGLRIIPGRVSERHFEELYFGVEGGGER